MKPLQMRKKFDGTMQKQAVYALLRESVFVSSKKHTQNKKLPFQTAGQS